jgi:hypothetical protein
MNRVDIIERVNQQHQLEEYWKQIVRTHGLDDSRNRRNVVYRHAFMVAAKEISGLTFKAIGNLLHRDHASVIHAQKSHEANMRFDKNYAKVYQNIYMDISDILVTDIDFFSREGLKDENKELRVRLMKLARMNRELIVERNETMSHFEELNDKVETLNIELSKEVVKNSNLNKKLSGIAW